MDDDFDNSELITLCGKAREESLTADDTVRLEAILLESESALRFYRRFMAVSSGLEQLTQVRQAENQASRHLESTLADPAASESPAVTIPSDARLGQNVVTRSRSKKRAARDKRQRLTSQRWAFYITAAVFILLASVATTVLLMNSGEDRVELAKLVASNGAVWSAGTSLDNGAPLFDDGYQLIAGAVKLRFKNQAELLVESPATFSLDSAEKATLDAGALTLFVPPSATGFQIQTPAALITDRGTRIGVRATPTGETAVHVFEGRADTVRHGETAVESLKAGEALSLVSDGDAVERFPASPEFFFKTVDQVDQIPAITGDIVSLDTAPVSVRRTERTHDARAFIFAEQKQVRLHENLAVTSAQPGPVSTLNKNDFELPAGEKLDSYFVQFVVPRSKRNSGEFLFAKGTIRFDRPIVGVIAFNPGQVGRSFRNPETDYPGDTHSGVEATGEAKPSLHDGAAVPTNRHFLGDRLEISEDRKVLSFHLRVHGKGLTEKNDLVDQIRILVQSEL